MADINITEEWLVDVLDDSMEMGWTTADGARAIMRALEASFGYRPPSGDQGSVAVGQATQGGQISDADAGEVVKRPAVQGEAEGVYLNHPVQAAWDSVSTLPAIAFSEQEADALAAALARPRAAVGEREAKKIAAQVVDQWQQDSAFTSDRYAVPQRDAIIWRAAYLAAILALQSPPAKVEG